MRKADKGCEGWVAVESNEGTRYVEEGWINRSLIVKIKSAQPMCQFSYFERKEAVLY